MIVKTAPVPSQQNDSIFSWSTIDMEVFGQILAMVPGVRFEYHPSSRSATISVLFGLESEGWKRLAIIESFSADERNDLILKWNLTEQKVGSHIWWRKLPFFVIHNKRGSHTALRFREVLKQREILHRYLDGSDKCGVEDDTGFQSLRPNNEDFAACLQYVEWVQAGRPQTRPEEPMFT